MNIYTTQDEKQITADYGKYLTPSAQMEDKLRPLCRMVHIPLTESTGDWEEIGEARAEQIRAAKRAASGEAQLNQQQLALQMRLAAMTINTMQLTDAQALEVKDLYPTWENLMGQTLPVGFKLQYGGQLYKVLQEHTAQEEWKPGTETASLYALVSAEASVEHAGTKEDPIPYEQMMLIEKDKYYTQYGVLYIGLMDAPNGYPNDLKDLPTLAKAVNEECTNEGLTQP